MVHEFPAVGFTTEDVGGPVREIDALAIDHVINSVLSARRVPHVHAFNHDHVGHFDTTT